ncbi:GNAT family N-acetyltransferase [Marinicella rhabdoformis]|uniref:GNAT family N-acetyltransferase n=1 Tax=Marinicella rhabdoformis TaxID=2580566 RepID=UPI0012AEBF50|nr:GNAT family N-acetyltransferase [Marinicella rhabdoformis]
MTDLQPTFIGQLCEIRPLLASDFDALYAVASDPEIWAQHPASDRYQKAHFKQHFFEPALASKSAFVVLKQGQIIGSTRYYDLDKDKREIAIGYTFIGKSFWAQGVNTEMKALMIDHVSSWAKKIWFHVAKQNMRSRKAVDKLGATYVKEEASTVDGVTFTRLHYRLLL